MVGTPDLMLGFHSLQAAAPGYQRAHLMYDGDIEEIFTSPFVRRLLHRAGVESLENVNYAHIPVDAVADRLRVLSVTAVDTEEGNPQDNSTQGASATARIDAANQALAHVIDRNQIDAEFDGLHLNVSEFGDAYLLVWPVLDEAGQVVDVDVLVNSPTTVRIIYKEESPLEKAFTIKSWTTPDPDDARQTLVRANLYYDDHLERFVTVARMDGSDIEHWVEYEQGDEGDDLGEAEIIAAAEAYPPGVDQNPWFHLRNFRPYGRPEHRNAYGPQQLIHKLIEAQAATIDFQTFPQRYLLMDPKADDFLQNLTDPFNSEDDAEDPEDPGNVTQLRGDPAAIWKLFGARDAGEFSVANPENFLNPVDRYIRMMSETTSTPIYEFGMSEPPSGEALRIAREPLYAKVADRQAAYGPVESDAFEFALHLLGFDNVKIQLSWMPVNRVDDQAGWAAVQAKQAAGVPMIEALVEAGYPREQVETWFTGEHAETVDIQRRVDMLATIATAVQGLGAAIALGAVDQSAVKALVARILGDLSPAGFDLAAAAAQTDEGPPPEWSRISTHNVIGQRAGGGGPVGGLATVQDAPGPDAAPAGDQPGQG